MGLFDNFAKKASDMAAQAAQAAQKGIEKSGDLIEIGNINRNIKGEEDKINKMYIEIGKSIYDRYQESGASTDPSFDGIFSQINASMEMIQSFKDKIAQINAGSPPAQEGSASYEAPAEAGSSSESVIPSAVEPITPITQSPAPSPEPIQTIEPLNPPDEENK
jgi:hypothetical protein